MTAKQSMSAIWFSRGAAGFVNLLRGANMAGRHFCGRWGSRWVGLVRVMNR